MTGNSIFSKDLGEEKEKVEGRGGDRFSSHI